MIKARDMVQAILLDQTHIKYEDEYYWKLHCKAVRFPPSTKAWPIMNMLNSLADYIDNFAANNCGEEISTALLASEYIEPMISALGNLLNYEIHGLNAGKVSEALSYLRMLLCVGTSSIGTMPNDETVLRFSRLMKQVWDKRNGRST